MCRTSLWLHNDNVYHTDVYVFVATDEAWLFLLEHIGL
jgi:hypothetical protein